MKEFKQILFQQALIYEKNEAEAETLREIISELNLDSEYENYKENGMIQNSALEVLDKIEDIRHKAELNPNEYRVDFTIRIIEAIIAKYFGFKSRVDWSERLLSNCNNAECFKKQCLLAPPNIVSEVNDYFCENLPYFDLIFIIRKSLNIYDKHLYMVVARSKSNNKYTVWTCYNSETKSLNHGHYDLNSYDGVYNIINEFFTE